MEETEEEKLIELDKIALLFQDLIVAGYYIAKTTPSTIHSEENKEVNSMIMKYSLLEIEVEIKAKEIIDYVNESNNPTEHAKKAIRLYMSDDNAIKAQYMNDAKNYTRTPKASCSKSTKRGA